MHETNEDNWLRLSNQAQLIRQVSWTCSNSGLMWMLDDDLHPQISVQLWIITEMINPLSPQCTRRARVRCTTSSGIRMTLILLILQQLPLCGPRMTELWCPVFCLETKKATQDFKKSMPLWCYLVSCFKVKCSLVFFQMLEAAGHKHSLDFLDSQTICICIRRFLFSGETAIGKSDPNWRPLPFLPTLIQWNHDPWCVCQSTCANPLSHG